MVTVICDVDMSADGKFLVTSAANGSIVVWDPDLHTPMQTLKVKGGFTRTFVSPTWFDESRYIVAVGPHGIISFFTFDAETGLFDPTVSSSPSTKLTNKAAKRIYLPCFHL